MTATLAAPIHIPALAPADNSKEDRFVAEFTVGEEVEVSEMEGVEEIVEVDEQVVEADGDESDIVNRILSACSASALIGTSSHPRRASKIDCKKTNRVWFPLSLT